MGRFTGPDRTSIREFADRGDLSGFGGVVSLHAHTHHSRETMADILKYVLNIPVVGRLCQRELRIYESREGMPVDLAKGRWHPPVSARTVFESEVVQIESRFGMASFVSVTDHDDISAGFELQALYAERRAPISVEWTVPFGRGFFHLGVHNLPSSSAEDWFAHLAAVTAERSSEAVAGMLASLDEERDVLVVFNHPLWDLAEVGRDEHTRALRRFLDAHGSRLHAMELNGYRPWEENDGVRLVAAEAGLPLVAGGDRHGLEPNALLNLTCARSFGEFVAEVRDGFGHIVVMPEYRRHLGTRILASVSDVLRPDRSNPAGQYWTDRVSWDVDGREQTLTGHWPDGGPFWVRSTFGAFRLMTSPVVLPVVRAALEVSETTIERGSLPPAPAGRTAVEAIGMGDAN
jgi:hypothetical protein